MFEAERVGSPLPFYPSRLKTRVRVSLLVQKEISIFDHGGASKVAR